MDDRAWMFAAGLLLGFSLFAQGNSSGKETEDAFHEAREVLKKIAELSPQAGHYFQILTSFSDAIASYQQKLSQEKKQKASQYMDQIFTRDNNDQAGNTVPTSSTRTALNLPAHGSETMNPLDSLDSGRLAGYNMTDGPYGMMISEGFPWPADDFNFDWQTCAPLFDDVF